MASRPRKMMRIIELSEVLVSDRVWLVLENIRDKAQSSDSSRERQDTERDGLSNHD